MRRLSGDAGVALVAVLWFTAAIAAMAAAFASLARGEVMRNRNLVEAIRARAVLEAGLERAALELVTPTVEPGPRGVELVWPFAGAEVRIAIAGESGRLDLNAAGPETIAALAKELGADRKLASRIADAVLDWRDENALRRPDGAEDRDYRSAERPGGAADAPFGHVGELRQLLPVEPEMYERMRDLVTVATGHSQPDGDLAPLPLRRAMLGAQAVEREQERERGGGSMLGPAPSEAKTGAGESSLDRENHEPGNAEDKAEDGGDNGGFVDPASLYAVRLDVRLASGYLAHADAVIWMQQEAANGRPYRVLDWEPSPWRPEEPD